MTSTNLDNLVKVGHLKSEPPDENEVAGLFRSGEARFKDATNSSLAAESRFDLAYNAAHALSLAALRLQGYRPANRFIVFQTLPHTLGLGPEVWRILAKAHDMRNLAEYEGHLELDNRLLEELIEATRILIESLVQTVV